MSNRLNNKNDDNANDEEQEFLISQNSSEQKNAGNRQHQEKSRDYQPIFEKLCILFVILALFIVLLVISGILISTFKAEETQKKLEQLAQTTLQTPIIDKNVYKLLTLQNKLKVLLVQDHEAENSYVAIDVNAGSWLEPENINGLAHFLEHMIFLASEKYNDTAFFDSFLSHNGGFSNAYTSDTHTNYFFKIQPKGLEFSLKIFSQMFTSPLFLQDQGTKESQNVENEFQIDFVQDGWILQNFISVICSPDHPMSRFTVGTVDSLINIPQQQEINVFEKLSEFFNNYYSSNIMSLVIYSNHDVEELEQFMLHAEFQNIKNKELQRPNFTRQGKPIAQENVQSFYKLQINSDSKVLQLIVQLDSLSKEYKKRSIEYIQQMITYTGRNGFLDLLKQQGLLIDITLDIMHESEAFSLIQFSFYLTEFGFSAPGSVMKLFFTFLQKVKKQGIDANQFNYLKKIAINKFDYKLQDQQDIMDKVSQMANYLNIYPSNEILKTDFLYEDFNKEFIENVIDQIQKNDNSVFILCSSNIFSDGENIIKYKEQDVIGKIKQFQEQTNQFYNELYDIKYSQIKLDDTVIKQMKAIDQQFYQLVTMPGLNSYVPNDMNIITLCNSKEDPNIDESEVIIDISQEFDQNNNNKSQTNQNKVSDNVNNKVLANSQNYNPYKNETYQINFLYQPFPDFNKNIDKCNSSQLLYEQKNQYPQIILSNVYYKLIRQFKVPQVNYIVQFASDLPIKSVQNQVLNQIAQKLIILDLQKSLSEPLNAGYNFDIQVKFDGFLFYMTGWSDKFKEFSDNVFKNIQNLKITDEDFKMSKEIVKSQYLDFKQSDAIQQAFKITLTDLIINPSFYYQDCIQAMNGLILQDIQQYYQSFWKTMKIYQLIVGNISPKSAQNMALSTLKNFKFFYIDQNQEQIRKIQGKNLVFRKYLDGNQDNLNSVTINYYQIGERTLENYVYMKFLVNLLNAHVYNYLRTERDLGYVAFAYYISHSCVDGVIIGVEGSKESPSVVDSLIENSLFDFAQELSQIAPEEFSNLMDSVKSSLIEKQQTLSAQTQYFYQFIQQGSPFFDQDEQALKYASQVKSSDLYDQFVKIFKTNAGKISLQLFSNAQNLTLESPLIDEKLTYSQIQPQIIHGKQDFVDFQQFQCKLNIKI